MSRNVKVTPHMLKSKEKEVVMRYPSITTVVIVALFCLSVLTFTWMKGDTLCEIKVKLGGIEVSASSICESVR
ncbi:Hok/Gef family protein [Rouxiella sp. T17]|uniref:Hok/Gef family protein n=1 Tax=Rouxiella sp. T17 TaxID=3085684 RepID=UPI003FA7B25F